MVSSKIQISLVVCSIPRVTRKKNVWDFCLRAQSGYAHFIKFYNSAIKLGLVRTRDTFTFVNIHGRENEAENWKREWNSDYRILSIGSNVVCFYHLFSCFWTCKHFRLILSVLFSACPGFSLLKKHNRSLQMRGRRYKFQFLDNSAFRKLFIIYDWSGVCPKFRSESEKRSLSWQLGLPRDRTKAHLWQGKPQRNADLTRKRQNSYIMPFCNYIIGFWTRQICFSWRKFKVFLVKSFLFFFVDIFRILLGGGDRWFSTTVFFLCPLELSFSAKDWHFSLRCGFL